MIVNSCTKKRHTTPAETNPVKGPADMKEEARSTTKHKETEAHQKTTHREADHTGGTTADLQTNEREADHHSGHKTPTRTEDINLEARTKIQDRGTGTERHRETGRQG